MPTTKGGANLELNSASCSQPSINEHLKIDPPKNLFDFLSEIHVGLPFKEKRTDFKAVSFINVWIPMMSSSF